MTLHTCRHCMPFNGKMDDSESKNTLLHDKEQFSDLPDTESILSMSNNVSSIVLQQIPLRLMCDLMKYCNIIVEQTIGDIEDVQEYQWFSPQHL